MNKLWKILKPPFYFFAAFLCAALISELVVRTFLPQKIYPVYNESAFGLLSVYKADFNGEVESGFPAYSFKLTVNSRHLRDLEEIEYAKDPSIFRVMLIGDSRTYGVYVNDDETFPYYLEKLLNKKIEGRLFEVINPGPLGGLGEIYWYLKNEGYKYSPDLVVLFSPQEYVKGLNPAMTKNVKYKKIRIDRGSGKDVTVDLEDLEINLNYQPSALLTAWIIRYFPFWDELSARSQLLTLMRTKLNTLFASENREVEDAEKSVHLYLKSLGIKLDDEITWKINDAVSFRDSPNAKVAGLEKAFYFSFLNDFSNLTQKIGSEFLVVNLPTHEKVYAYGNSKEESDLAPFKAIRYFKLNPKIYSEVLIGNLVPMFFPEDMHFTPAGNQLTAILLFNYLAQNDLIPTNMEPGVLADPFDAATLDELKNINARLNRFFSTIPKNLINTERATSKEYKEIYIRSIIPYIRAHLENNPGDFLGHYQAGLIYLNEQNLLDESDYNKALEHFLSALKLAQDIPWLSAELSHHISFIYYKLGNWLFAEKYALQAIETNPGYPFYHQAIGELYLYAGRYENAITAFKRSLELNPNNPNAFLFSGQAYLRLNDPEKAKDMFQRVLRIQPENKSAQLALEQFTRP